MRAALALRGCGTVGPDYTVPASDVPAAWIGLDDAVDPATVAATSADIGLWWRSLDDALLAALVDEAMQASPDLRSAQARLREARARRAVTRSDLWPSLAAAASGSRSESGDVTREAYSAGFDASWELDVFGGVRRGVEAANADVDQAVANLADTRVSLAAEVALNYVELRALQIRLGIARDNLASQSETLQLTEWRAEAGLVSAQDVEQARTSREQTRAQIPSLETSSAETEHRLDLLLGEPPGTLHARLAAVGDLPAVPTGIAVGIPADALRRRPDVRAAERRLAAETARVGVAQAARYPSFRLSGSIGIEALSFGDLLDEADSSSSLLGGITAPIFDAGRLRNQVLAQDAVREQALVAYEQAVLAALQEVEDALVALARNRESVEALTIATASARSAAELARQRYSTGLVDFQSVLDTGRSVLSAADSLASTRADGVLALIRLYKALGGGWSAPGDSRASGQVSR
jgi:NodT family efflux transporter outer membrane factor (OMF) lipoprotein